MNGMASGCCVCSDERGWAENPLVYCDGEGCNIGVHKACYGIVTVPEGPWYCRKCESQERSSRVRCELCPSKEGALKRSDSGGWAHVICGLYIPEVRFGSVQTMEPIVLSQIPTERFQKICYICEQSNRGSKASMGACMDCNKSGCRQQFHVTCAQSLGLLCEEPGNYQDNVKYCGYCHEHHSKLVQKKGSNVKVIPAFKPSCSNNANGEEVFDKKFSNCQANMQCVRKKSITKSTVQANSKSEHDLFNGSLGTKSHSPLQFTTDERTPTNAGVSLNNPFVSEQGTNNNEKDSRFTSSNFIESVLTPNDTIFTDQQKFKRRKTSEINANDINHDNNSIEEQKQSSLGHGPFQNSELDKIAKNYTSNDAEEIDDNDDDGESAVLNFVEEPNLSAIKSEPGNSNVSVISTKNSSTTPVISKSMKSNNNCITSTVETIPVTSSASPSSIIQKPTVFSSSNTQRNPSSISTPSVPTTSVANMPELKVRKGQNSSNTSSAPHMLGNQLNPASTMAQKMFDSLNDELQAHSIFSTADSQVKSDKFVGPPLYNKVISSTKVKESSKPPEPPVNGGPLASLSGSGNFPQSLEELLEKQWEQGGTFLMEQAQHFDIASLLTCLHKLRQENLELEEHIRNLKARRDHLLGVNARLAMPLAPISQPVNVTQPSQSGGQQIATPSHNKTPNMPNMSQQQGHMLNQPQYKQHMMSQNPNIVQQPMHPGIHSQPYPQHVTAPIPNPSEAGHLRNVSVPTSMYPASRANNAYQNSHPMENGMLTGHHQNSRPLNNYSSANHIRHHSSSNPMYMASPQQSSNPGVVVRSIPQPGQDIRDRR